jgi:exopolyphosphatase/guanosine-5'-triphosphate,3'-diphosphate pyrophosphatase
MAAVGKQAAPVLIMDIGGGSVEFIIADGLSILYKESYEIGGQRLMELFMDTDPISADAIEKIDAYLLDKLAPLLQAAEKFNPKVLIGSSGTFDTLCEVYWQTNKLNYRLEQLTQFDLPLTGYAEIANKLVAMNKEQRLAVQGMIPLRADMIVVAICLINFVIGQIATSQLIVSTYALKEGVLLATIAGKELQ